MVIVQTQDLQVEEALEKVAALSPEQFVRFQQELLQIEDDDDDTMTDEWLAKMNARMARVESGEAELISGDQARQRLREHLTKAALD